MKRPPLGLALVVVPAVALLVLHLAGARAYLGVLSGTRFDAGESALAVLYALAWFWVVLVAPIAVLARLLRAAGARIQAWSSHARPRRQAPVEVAETHG